MPKSPKYTVEQQEPNGEPNGLELDPIIEALLEHLPAPGDPWPQNDRKRWLQILEMALSLIYPEQPQATSTEPVQHGKTA
jgi:hypothetical protein